MPLEHDAWRACIAALAPEALVEVSEVIDLTVEPDATAAWSRQWSQAVS
jgi:hypothetical protein